MSNVFIYGLPASIDNAPMMNEQELDSAMSEARRSRAAWQQMQSQLKATYQKHPVITPKT